MTSLDRELYTIEANHLFENFGLSYGQIARYLKKHYDIEIHRSTVFRWLNK
jgi:hypothetical protein